MNSIFANEDDVTGKLLLPYLQDLGFDVSEISLETSFKIRLGKQKHKTGYSDILCRKDGKNLFVIEVKRDGHEITQDDIDQGISYARLLDNIAPFTIVTNGVKNIVFDSITKNELTGTNISEQSEFWKNDCILSTNEDLKIRYRALQNFVSLSEENLKIFSKLQIKSRMKNIVGSIDDLSTKFIKELHRKRQILHDIFYKFLETEDAKVFGMVGNAGVGKTNSICNLVLGNSSNNFVLFYNATISNAPIEDISKDLNLFFSQKIDSAKLLKQLSSLGNYWNKKTVIFIDAIDENNDKDYSSKLSDLAYEISLLDNIKLCISCKSNVWSRFLMNRNTKNYLYTELQKFHSINKELESNPGFLLKDFDDNEVTDIIPLYRNAFGFKGEVSEELLEQLKNGFFLRIFSTVYSNKQIPENIDDKNLIKKYLNQSLEATSIGVEKGLRNLSEIGKQLISYSFSRMERYQYDGVDLEDLVEKLNLPLNEEIPQELFSRNILVKSNNGENCNVAFYYSKIRDYIICYHSFRLQRLDNQQFYDILESFFQNHIGQSAISFYIKNASSNHLKIYEQFIKDKALDYVEGYSSYIEKHFLSFKKEFNPYTNGEIGVILPNDLINDDGYALFPSGDNHKAQIIYESFKNLINLDRDNPIFLKKARTVYGSNKFLLTPDQNKVIEENIYEQLKEIVEKGKLNEDSCDILLIEKLVNIVYFYHKKLYYDYKIKEHFLPRFNQIYPIELNDVKKRIYIFRATEYFERQYNGKRIDKKELEQEVQNAIKNKLEIPKLNITGDFPPIEELDRIIDLLIRKGYERVDEQQYLPCPDIDLKEVKILLKNKSWEEKREILGSIQYTQKQAKRYTTKFFKYLESAYKEVVELNFPTIKNNLSFYKGIPHEYIFYSHRTGYYKFRQYGFEPSLTNEVSVNFKYIDSKDFWKKERIKVFRGFVLENILYNRKPLQTISQINTRKVDKYCVIRNWVYQRLNDDFKDFLKEKESMKIKRKIKNQ